MRNNVALIITGLVATITVAALLASFVLGLSPERPAETPLVQDLASRQTGRLEALERTVLSEQAARRALEAEVATLKERLAALDTNRASDPSFAQLGRLMTEPVEAIAESRGASDLNTADTSKKLSGDPSVDRLVAGGFSVSEAESIVRRESEFQMEQLQIRYETAQAGQPLGAEFYSQNGDRLRDELGEEQYERYLEATGRPTSVRVDAILASSPAEALGLQPGDRITEYDDQRVFDIADLNRLTFEGEPGTTVQMRLVRGGEEIQIVLPRGPIGVQVSPFTSP